MLILHPHCLLNSQHLNQTTSQRGQLIKEQSVIFAKQFLALAQTRTVKENYTVFIEYMEGILAVNIPSNSRHNLPWMNRKLKRLIRKKGRRFKKAKKSGMDEDRARYLDIEQMVKRELRDANGFM